MKKGGFVFFILWLVIILFIPFRGEQPALSAEVEDLSNTDYFPNVLSLLRSARESIDIVMYMIAFSPEKKDSAVKSLLDEVVNAHERGVKVRVILEYRSSRDFEKTGKNYHAYRYLRENGLEVRFDNPSICSHNKVIVIDGEKIITGSTNWTEQALSNSNETNVLIESPELAAKILKRIGAVKLLEREEIDNTSSKIFVPRAFLEKNSYLKNMVGRHDGCIFDVYLRLLKDVEEAPSGEISLGYEEMAEILGLELNPESRLTINALLRSMERKYKLINLTTERMEPFKIKLLDYHNPQNELEIKMDEAFSIPLSYWDYNWEKTLTLKEKVCLFINLAEIKPEEGLGEWSLYKNFILKKYNINRHIFSDGMQGLRRYNIIELKYAPLKERKRSAATVYKFLGFFDGEAFEDGLEGLKEQFGPERVETAREYASVVFKGWDLAVIEDICQRQDLYEENLWQEVFSTIKEWDPASPKRCYGYALGMLEGIKNRNVGN